MGVLHQTLFNALRLMQFSKREDRASGSNSSFVLPSNNSANKARVLADKTLPHHAVRDRRLKAIDKLVIETRDSFLVDSAPKVEGKLLLASYKGSNKLHVRRVGVHVDHALVSNILVQPNAPADVPLSVDAQLFM